MAKISSYRNILSIILCIAVFIGAASCSDIYEDDFRIDTSNPTLKRPGSTLLNVEENDRNVFIMFSFGYNNLSMDLQADIEEMLTGDVPSYRIEDDVVLVLSHKTAKYYDYKTPSAPALIQYYKDQKGRLVRDTLKVFADTTVASRKAIVKDVLTLAKDIFPARSYGMLLSSHGTGWAPEKYCYSPPDKSNSIFPFQMNSYSHQGLDKYEEENPLVKSIGSHYAGRASESIEIEIPDLADAIPMHLDYIIFDACFMGGVEVAYELKDKCDRICFSQTEILSSGMDYKNLLSHIFSDSGADLEAIASDYYDLYRNQSGYMRSATVSVVDCRMLDPLAEVVKDNAALIRSLSADQTSRKKVQGYYRTENSVYIRCHGIFFDLYDILAEAGASESDLLKAQDALEECITQKFATDWFMNDFKIETFSGLSMYLQDSERTILNSYYKSLRWNQATGMIE